MLREGRLNFGVHVRPQGRDFGAVKELCLTAESLGYDLLTLTDHFMNGTRAPLECWTTLSALGALTNRIALGSLVSCVNYRHPTVLAKMATTVDIITGGRLIFGIGAGWHELEFKSYMGRFPSPRERLDGLEDAIQICRSMFQNQITNFTGKTYSAKDTANLPRPIQKRIPIMVGGSGEKRTLKIVAKYADISNFFVNCPQELEHKLRVLRNHCEHANRDFSTIKIAVGMRPVLDLSEETVNIQAGRIARTSGISPSEAETMVRKSAGVENVLSAVREYERLGAHLIIVSSTGIREMKLFRDQIMSNVG